MTIQSLDSHWDSKVSDLCGPAIARSRGFVHGSRRRIR